MYAHLLATRGREYIVEHLQSGTVGGGDRRSRPPRDETEAQRKAREIQLAQQLNVLIKVDEAIKNRMFFC